MRNIPEPDRPDTVGELADLLESVGRRVRRAVRAELEPFGLTPARGRALRAIVVADDAGNRVRMGDLAEALRIAPRSATEVVESLVAAGLVERDRDAGDRRAVALRPTDEGRAAATRMSVARRRAVADLSRALSDTELGSLRDLLRRLDQG